MSTTLSNRQLYPDLLRSTSLAKIVLFHFISWPLLTYLPSLGIMFALGGWFMAISLSTRPPTTVVFHRFARLLPTWWAFALLTLIGGFFYARGANVPLEPTFAWLFPYQRVEWKLDNAYSNDAIAVVWYIAAYLWLMMLSPVLLYVYKKLSWFALYIPVFVMLFCSQYFPEHRTVFGQTLFDMLIFGGCWMLGFTKADGTIDKVPRYLVWLNAIVCSACGIFLTYETQTLSSNPAALSVMSFGVAMLLLSFNPDFSRLPSYVKGINRTINKYAVTIYLFHNLAIDASYEVGRYLGAYELAARVGIQHHSALVGDSACFVIMLGLLYVIIKTVGIVETHGWGRAPVVERKLNTRVCSSVG